LIQSINTQDYSSFYPCSGPVNIIPEESVLPLEISMGNPVQTIEEFHQGASEFPPRDEVPI